MLVLLGIGLLAGIVTALSPCVLPVLPIVLAGGATGSAASGGRRPLSIVAGIVVSFTVFTLTAAWLLDRLGLPQDLLRNIAIVLLFVVAATLLWPRAGELLERPLRALTRRPGGDLGGGFLLGASLGLVFVPCAGPVLAAVTVLAAGREIGLDGVVLTLSYALGAAIPLLAIALLGQRAALALRSRATTVRRVSGVLVAAAALAIAFGLDTRLQTNVPGYTLAVQNRIESSGRAQRELERLTGARRPEATGSSAEDALPDYGLAPEFIGIAGWLNTPGGRALSLDGLHGRVVLIDFWTYSCINCLRTLPYLRAWDERYRSKGLTIIGVHTPEFAFERVPANVRENAAKLGVRYPIALDPDYGTWNAWHNQYWPAKYLIDRDGHVRYYHFGEGEYTKSEDAIRTLLAVGGTKLPAATHLADRTPTGRVTPETYLGYERVEHYVGSPLQHDVAAAYTLPATLAQNELSYGGRWTVGKERIVARRNAVLRLAYRARKVHLVLGGTGTVQVLVDGRAAGTIRVDADRLYTLVERAEIADHLLELRFSRGVAGYAFTFG